MSHEVRTTKPQTEGPTRNPSSPRDTPNHAKTGGVGLPVPQTLAVEQLINQPVREKVTFLHPAFKQRVGSARTSSRA